MKDSSPLHSTETPKGPAVKTLLGGESAGKRLIPHVIDETARETPDLECVSIPRSNNPRDGWKPVSWSQISNAVNYAAHMLIAQEGNTEPGTFPTVAYIGLDDPRYLAFVIGAIKAGYQALLISPRNSIEAQINLFTKTKCKILYHEKQYESMIQPWLGASSGMKSVAVSPWDEWIVDGIDPIPYTKTFAEAEWDPYVVLHTSGSTGLPKAVVVRQGVVAVNDLHRQIPARNGNLPWFPTWANFPNPRHLLTMPLFHGAGIILSSVLAFYYNAPIAFREPSRPITGDNVLEWLRNSNPGWTILPPAILEHMSHLEESVDELKKLHLVGFGGGSIGPDSPNRLAKLGVQTMNAIASTEYPIFPYFFQPDPTMWQWFIIPSDKMGIEWRQVGKNTYEQVIVRKDKHPGLQSCFYTFPELEEFSTKDLYQPHPTLPDHWMHVGRADDIMVFSTGEKLNPVTIEGTVMGHPEILGAQVVGSKQFHAALMIEPAQYPKSEEEKQLFLDRIWPVIDKVNTETVAHGRISRGDIFFTDPKKPFPRAGKGTIQRAMAMDLYAKEIEEFFNNNTDGAAVAVDLDVTSESKLADSICQLVQHVFKDHGIDADDDFFIKGIDSLQVIQLSRELKTSLEKAGLKLNNGETDPRVIYKHPSIRQLAEYAFSLVYTDREEDVPEGTVANEETIFNEIVEKYTKDLPASVPNKPGPAEKGQVVIITGTTGALGSYLLDFALKSPNIMKVICFNRGDDSQHRQIEASTSRGLSTDFSRAEFLHVDLSEPDLGLTAAVEGRLLNEVDRIIHNAWPVNFNMSITSFEPHIRGVRHLIHFSVQARKSVPITFISSVGTVENWPNLDTPVPEKALPDWSLAMFGYGQAKLAGSIILDNAAKISNVPSAIVRVGQIAGPRGKQGKWNPQEWLPSLIQSSLHLGLLPESLGTFDGMGWSPVEDIATMVLDIAGVTINRSTEDVSGYFHVLNPKPTHWLSLIPALREFYGERIREVVPLEEWVSALEKSQGDSVTIEHNPAVKLIDTYRSAAGGAKMGVKAVSMDTARTESCSSTMRQMEPVSPELMKHWCEQWKF